jgi:CO dehydrogenase/acetyl-CoA synthase beta subunit
MRLDHFVVHIDQDPPKLQSLKDQIVPMGFPFNPTAGKRTKGFQVANIWIGDQYLELIWLKTQDGGGWRRTMWVYE